MLALLMVFAGTVPGRIDAPSDETPIMGGELTEPGEFEEVVALDVGSNLCTGTLIAPDIVMTAAHCVEVARDSISVYWGSDLVAGRSMTSRQWGAHPSYCPECKQNAYDFGYVVLPSPLEVDLSLPLVDQDEWDVAMRKGGFVELVGYGTTEESTGTNVGLGVKRKVTTEIHSFTDRGLEFFAGGDGKDSCKGDSGGPAFIHTEANDQRLAGILSRGTTPCGGGGYYGAPYTALCWVRDETAVDLLPEGCEDCSCLDTEPPDSGRCRVDPGERGVAGAPWLLTPLLWCRRRPSESVRSTGRHAAGLDDPTGQSPAPTASRRLRAHASRSVIVSLRSGPS